MAAFPDLSFEIRPGLFPELLQALIEGRLDLFVSVLPDAMDESLVAVEELGQVEYVTVIGTGKSSRSLWVMGDNPPDITEQLRLLGPSHGGDPLAPRIRSYSTVFTKAVLHGSAAISILPKPIVADDIASGRLRRLPGADWSWRRPLVVCTRRSAMPSRELATTMDTLRQAARKALD